VAVFIAVFMPVPFRANFVGGAPPEPPRATSAQL